MASETHPTSSIPGNISIASKTHQSSPQSPVEDVVMAMETHLTTPTSPENVFRASEVHLTSSTPHGNVLMTSDIPLTPSTSGISNTYSLGMQVKLPKLDLRKFDGDISKAFESSVHTNTKLAPIEKFSSCEVS